MDHPTAEELPGGRKTFEEFLESIQRIECRPNPQKQANLERCSALARELAEIFQMKPRIRTVPGGLQFDFRFFATPLPCVFNRLLGELIARSSEFYPMRDPKDPCYIILSMTVYGQDRIWDGRLMRDT